MWDELDMYRPHNTNAKILLKRAGEDKIFSLLNSLKPKYENLKCNILMDSTLPTLSSVCATIQWMETQKKAMNVDLKHSLEKIESSALSPKKNDRKRFVGTKKGGITIETRVNMSVIIVVKMDTLEINVGSYIHTSNPTLTRMKKIMLQ